MEICYLEMSALLRKFFRFDHLLLEDLAVGPGSCTRKIYLISFFVKWKWFVLNFFFFKCSCALVGNLEFFFKSLIIYLSGHTFFWFIFSPSNSLGVGRRYLCLFRTSAVCCYSWLWNATLEMASNVECPYSVLHQSMVWEKGAFLIRQFPKWPEPCSLHVNTFKND